MPDVGYRIRELREKLGMTQDDLAEQAGMNRVTIAKYESGRIEPSSRALPRLAKALGTSADALLGIVPDDDGASDITDDELMQMREDMRRNPELRTLFSLTKGATKQEMRQLEGIVRALRGSNDHEDTDGA